MRKRIIKLLIYEQLQSIYEFFFFFIKKERRSNAPMMNISTEKKKKRTFSINKEILAKLERLYQNRKEFTKI